MALPSNPQRKAANVNTNSAGSVSGGSNSYAPSRKSAQAFGNVDVGSAYKRPSAGITPGGVPINDKDAGNGPGNVRGDKSSQHMSWPKIGGE